MRLADEEGAPAAVLVALAHLAALLAAEAQSTVTPPISGTTGPVTADDGGQTLAATQALLPGALPVGSTDHPDSATDGVDTRAAVLAVIRRRPVTIAELVNATGRSRTTIVGHLTALTDDGTITRDDDKRYRAVIRPHLVDGVAP